MASRSTHGTGIRLGFKDQSLYTIDLVASTPPSSTYSSSAVVRRFHGIQITFPRDLLHMEGGAIANTGEDMVPSSISVGFL
jgi:hypothetical protein